MDLDFDATEIEVATATEERSRFGLPLFLFAAVAATFTWSFLSLEDPAWWWTQATPVLLGTVVFVATAKRFPLTPLSYVLFTIATGVALVGASFAGGAVPEAARLQESLRLGQNPFPAIVRLVEGVALAILLREILLRKSPLQPGRWLAAIVLASSLAVFDLWAIATAGVHQAFGVTFAATDLGAVAETALVFCGAALSLLALQSLHDRQLVRIWLDVTRASRAIDWRRV